MMAAASVTGSATGQVAAAAVGGAPTVAATATARTTVGGGSVDGAPTGGCGTRPTKAVAKRRGVVSLVGRDVAVAACALSGGDAWGCLRLRGGGVCVGEGGGSNALCGAGHVGR